jgi:hypothetical protein
MTADVSSGTPICNLNINGVTVPAKLLQSSTFDASFVHVCDGNRVMSIVDGVAEIQLITHTR